MSIHLFKHNEDAYRAVETMLEEKQMAAVIHPTGTGKSMIAFKLVEQHPHKHFLWLSPSEYIYKTQLENIDTQLSNIEYMYPCYYPTNRSLKALIKNTKIAWKVLRKEKPDLIISSGAAVAVPFFYLGKLFGAKLVYIEVFDRIDKPTMTGKMVYPIVDKFIVQWEEQKEVYPKAINLGSIF